MPWCHPCERYYNPTSLTPEGRCPKCGETVVDKQPIPRVPWHFWIIVVAAGAYLGWRAIQAIGWLL